jgi:hypothetical protein
VGQDALSGQAPLLLAPDGTYRPEHLHHQRREGTLGHHRKAELDQLRLAADPHGSAPEAGSV